MGALRLLGLLLAATARASAGADDAESSLLQQRALQKTSCPPIAYLKTHKTGSSTMQSILLRLAVKCKMEILWPQCSGDFNYPSHFPGPVSETTPPEHQFDIILHHAVLNVSAFRSYLRPSAFFVTVLREPVSQMTSVFNWYRPNYGWASFDSFLEYLGTSPEEQHRPRRIGRHLGIARNFQARDLGFYEAGNAANASAEDIDAWIHSLSDVFSYPSAGLVVVNERYDQGLVLLQQALKVDLEDVAYIAMRVEDASSSNYQEPSAVQAKRIRRLAHADVRLYDYFNSTFTALWDRHGDETSAAKLQQLVGRTTQSCKTRTADSSCELFVENLPALRNIVRRKFGLQPCSRPGDKADEPE